MNGVLERYELKLKQTSKGIWYCDGLTVTNANEITMLLTADQLMTRVEIILADHNIEEAEPTKNKWEKAAEKLSKERKEEK